MSAPLGPGERRGFVSIVGAGPGDPDLLTVRAVRRLEAADLVLYDALVEPTVVALATRAQRFSVGKRARRPSVSQPTIDRLMIRAARRGKAVVRLKSGDPFVLGRGGEEVAALTAAGLPCEVVPGVTSAVAAPGLAGIPVTHRGLASGFLVVSGHDEAVFGPLVDPLPPHGLTLVVLMGLATRARLAARLLAAGWRQDTPVAVIADAGRARMRTWIGTLSRLESEDARQAAGTAPATIVIGDVVRRQLGVPSRGAPPGSNRVAAIGRTTVR